MKTIYKLTFKSALKDPFLIFWSLLVPIVALVILNNFNLLSFEGIKVFLGVVAISIVFYGLVNTAFSAFRQRKRGVYNLLHVVPMPLWQYIFGTASAWAFIATLCGLITFLVGAIILNLAISFITIITITMMMFIAALGYVFLSFIISSLSNNEGQVSIISNIFILPLIGLSDAFYSLENGPWIVKLLSNFNPFQWSITGLRASLNGEYLLWGSQVGLLFVGFCLILLLAVRTFKYESN